MDKLYNDLSERYSVSAKEYFKILQLAIFHITGDDVKTSYGTTQYKMTPEIYDLACQILMTLNRERIDND